MGEFVDSKHSGHPPDSNHQGMELKAMGPVMCANGPGSDQSSPHQNMYINPMDSDSHQPLTPPPRYTEAIGSDDIFTDSDSTSQQNSFPRPCRTDSHPPTKGPNQIVQRLEEGLTTTWRRQPSPKLSKHSDAQHPPSSSKGGGGRSSSSSGPAAVLRQMFKKQRGGSAIGGPSAPSSAPLFKPRAYLSEDDGMSHSSSDSINSQGSAGHFRKAPSFGGRTHSSPGTGKKLANYHLIANPQSGKCNKSSLLLSEGESMESLPHVRHPDIKKKSILKRDAMNMEETENLLSPDTAQESHENGEEGQELDVGGMCSIGISEILETEFISPAVSEPPPPHTGSSWPGLSPPPSKGTKARTKPSAQTIKFADVEEGGGCIAGGSDGLKGDPNARVAGGHLSPELIDESEQVPSASPGMIKIMKELDNQDQQMLGTAGSGALHATSPVKPAQLNLSPAKPQSPTDSNITADKQPDLMDTSYGDDREKSALEMETNSSEKEKGGSIENFFNIHSKIEFIDDSPHQ